eukprot:6210630-Pleurochrysis_carterae.AAC.6
MSIQVNVGAREWLIPRHLQPYCSADKRAALQESTHAWHQRDSAARQDQKAGPQSETRKQRQRARPESGARGQDQRAGPEGETRERGERARLESGARGREPESGAKGRDQKGGPEGEFRERGQRARAESGARGRDQRAGPEGPRACSNGARSTMPLGVVASTIGRGASAARAPSLLAN